MLGRKSFSKGVKVEAGESQVVIDISIIVKYGVRIPDVAWKIQEKCKQAVESMTGLEVKKVNVNVQGVSFDNVKTEAAEE